MASEASMACSVQLSMGSIFFFLLFILFIIMAFFLRLKPRCICDCETCKAYLTSSWSMEYNNLCDWYTHLLSKSPTGTIHIHVLGNVITANPDNVEYILKTKFQNYPKGKPFSAILGDLLGKGIFNADGDFWRFQRKVASLELGSLSVRSYAFRIVSSEIGSRLIPLLSSAVESRECVDLQDIFRRFSFDSICKLSFGVDPGCLNLSHPVSEFASAFDLASKLSAERAITAFPVVWQLKRFFNLGSEKKLRRAINSVHELAEAVIMHKRSSSYISDQEDLLSRFMGTINDDVLLRDIIISFLLAGRDTVASALIGFFFLLSRNPKVLERIREESDRVITDDDELVSYDRLREMHYLQAAMQESLRLYPPVQFDSKFCEEDDVLADGTFLGRGTRVTYHPYAMGRMERIWGSDCLEFRPERWIRGGVFRQENPYKYPVFQAGPRVCLGKEMAMVEMKAVALSLIRKFDLQVVLPPATPPKFVSGLSATYAGGLPVVVGQRKR